LFVFKNESVASLVHGKMVAVAPMAALADHRAILRAAKEEGGAFSNDPLSDATSAESCCRRRLNLAERDIGPVHEMRWAFRLHIA